MKKYNLFVFICLFGVAQLFMVNNSRSAIEEIPFNQLPEFEQELIAELDFYLQYDLLDNLEYLERDIEDSSEYEGGEDWEGREADPQRGRGGTDE